MQKLDNQTDGQTYRRIPCILTCRSCAAGNLISQHVMVLKLKMSPEIEPDKLVVCFILHLICHWFDKTYN